MSEMVTLQISEDVVERAKTIAVATQRRFEDVLAEWLDRAATEIPVDQLPDDEVMALVELMLPESQQQELDNLLDDQSESRLTEAGKVRLDELMQIYRQALIRKAYAVKVAVDRGLMPPLG
jgi:aconitase B